MLMTNYVQFNLDSVVGLDLPNESKWNERNGQYYINCPFCKGIHKLNVNTDKGLWRCNKCGEGGNAIQLHSKIKKVSQKQSVEELKEALLKGNIKLVENSNVSVQRMMPVDRVTREYVYNNLLNELDLKFNHRKNLRERGLTDADIERLKYRSYPQSNLAALAKKAIAECDFSQYEGIPGFYDLSTEQPYLMKHGDGFLIPVVDMYGKIEGFQIRASKTGPDVTRYCWMSSSKMETGCSVTGCCNIHHAGNWKRVDIPKVIGLTEGALKADVASTIYDRLYPNEEHLFLGLTGVNNIGQLKAELESFGKRGLEEVHIYVDMDYRDKKEVAKALEKIKTVIESTDVFYDEPDADNSNFYHQCKKKMKAEVMNWNAQYKGIDDYLLAYELERKKKGE